MIAVKCPALRMLGLCVAKSEEAAALIPEGLDWFSSQTALCLVPMNEQTLVHTLYGWDGHNVETHLFEARVAFKPFASVNMPSFLPETG